MIKTPTAKEIFLAEVSAYGLPNRHIEMWKACEATAKAIRDLCEPLPIANNTPDLVAEIERLRARLKEAEWLSYVCGDAGCLFCGADKHNADGTQGEHYYHCTAFTPEGEVK